MDAFMLSPPCRALARVADLLVRPMNGQPPTCLGTYLLVRKYPNLLLVATALIAPTQWPRLGFVSNLHVMSLLQKHRCHSDLPPRPQHRPWNAHLKLECHIYNIVCCSSLRH